MRILSLSQNPAGGAAQAALRLNDGLRQKGCEVTWLTGTREPGGPITGIEHGRLRCAQWWDKHVQARLRAKGPFFHSFNSLRPGLPKIAERIGADVVHLHWPGRGFIHRDEIREMAASRRFAFVWTMHDEWALGNGPHYHGATLPEQGPQWKTLQAVIAPSRWLESRMLQQNNFAQQSIYHIPYGLSLDWFSPGDVLAARARFVLPSECPVLLFGADSALVDPRKGFDVFKGALECLKRRSPKLDLRILLFGADDAPETVADYPVHSAGRVSDPDTLRSLYQAATLYILPTRSDNLPNTLLESIACGCPAIASDVGGVPDIIIPGKSGHLFPAEDAEALCKCIEHALRSPPLNESSRAHAVANFDLCSVAQRHLELYRQLLVQKGGR